jgi:hypothetical protein
VRANSGCCCLHRGEPARLGDVGKPNNGADKGRALPPPLLLLL